ncbi:RNA polymerase sigma factor, sigma-70 family [Neorhodopirellula lusitana]|uniref:RNA polymerase sigma factor, sigma-70 family n=1 Tax=Neorhodopirellula lusitana TaxID=445327 RepID=A0ABY1PSC0_9BACT|nr:ECF-type sigma factor [Neorhodopirellula lusitana]SMP44010.1 RNA polymerase sigma factor, sigma-70 family [Neorhodopirellula lusitana]
MDSLNAASNAEQPSGRWRLRLREGDSEATRRLWDMYFQRMVLLARKRLRGMSGLARDEEDVALSAFKSFCLGLQRGKYDAEHRSTNLWPLLVTITVRKAVDLIRYENRQKRSSKRESEASSVSTTAPVNVDELIASEPTPEQVALAAEAFENLLQMLDSTGDTSLRVIAIESLEGSSPSQIAMSLNCSTRTVQRKLQTVNALWESSSR